MSNKLNNVHVIQQKNSRTLEIFIDELKLQGVTDISFDRDVNSPWEVTVTFYINTLTVEREDENESS